MRNGQVIMILCATAYSWGPSQAVWNNASLHCPSLLAPLMVFFRVLWTSNGSLGEYYNCQIWIFFPSSLGMRDDKIVHGVRPAWKGWLSFTPAVGAGRLTAALPLSLLASKSMPQSHLQICSKTTFPHPRPISRRSPRTSPPTFPLYSSCYPRPWFQQALSAKPSREASGTAR